jgi:hypothetical protein
MVLYYYSELGRFYELKNLTPLIFRYSIYKLPSVPLSTSIYFTYNIPQYYVVQTSLVGTSTYSFLVERSTTTIVSVPPGVYSITISFYNPTTYSLIYSLVNPTIVPSQITSGSTGFSRFMIIPEEIERIFTGVFPIGGVPSSTSSITTVSISAQANTQMTIVISVFYNNVTGCSYWFFITTSYTGFNTLGKAKITSTVSSSTVLTIWGLYPGVSTITIPAGISSVSLNISYSWWPRYGTNCFAPMGSSLTSTLIATVVTTTITISFFG